MAISMGIDIGQRSEPTGLCVAETQTREAGGVSAVHHLIRHLERLSIGTSFPEIARRAGEVAMGVERAAGDSPKIFVDATGIGRPIVELIEEAMPCARAVTTVYFNFGDRRVEHSNEWRPEIHLGKAYLVSRLQALLQAGRLHLPRTPESESLAEELLEYEIRIEADANERYGAFRVGHHDDLVTALGLAVQTDPVGPGIF